MWAAGSIGIVVLLLINIWLGSYGRVRFIGLLPLCYRDLSLVYRYISTLFRKRQTEFKVFWSYLSSLL